MNRYLTFDDVLIRPQFSDINSRSEVDLTVEIPGYDKFFPVISANMDTVTGEDMAATMFDYCGLGALHRFWSIEDNCKAIKNLLGQGRNAFCSFGLGDTELNRFSRLYSAGARLFILDVAHAAQQQVVDQYRKAKEFKYAFIVVGNFASGESLYAFARKLGYWPDGIKIGIGPGSACTTRLKTGIGIPQFSAIREIMNFVRYNSIGGKPPFVIADGGMRTPGDIAKALGAGADMVMLGGMLAGTDETPGEVIHSIQDWANYQQKAYSFKQYRGSASKESYDDQGKDTSWRTAEGESFTVPYKGPVADVLADIEGGLRSAFTYVGARSLKEFHEKVEFIEISSAGYIEGTPHGKKS